MLELTKITKIYETQSSSEKFNLFKYSKSNLIKLIPFKLVQNFAQMHFYYNYYYKIIIFQFVPVFDIWILYQKEFRTV